MTTKPSAAVDMTSLLAIEELDVMKKNILDQLAEIPEKRETIQAEIAMIDRALKEKEQAIAAKEKNLSAAELDLKSSQVNEGEKRLKLNSVKTQKEYDAIKQEIDSHAGERGGIEERILLLMDEISDLKNLVKKEKVSGDAKKKDLQEQLSSIVSHNTRLTGEAAAVEERIHQKFQELPQDAQRQYSKLRAIFPNDKILAKLSQAEDSAFICSMCNSPVSHQIVINIKRQIALHHCEYCRRLLMP